MSRYEIAEETETHMTVVAKFPKGVTRRQLDVEMSKTSIKVMKKGASQPILEVSVPCETSQRPQRHIPMIP